MAINTPYRIREADWKVFRRLRPLALERFSQRILDQCRDICTGTSLSAHERYGNLYELIRERDKAMAYIFDNPSRSRALMSLEMMRMEGLLEEQELAEFSQETRDRTDPQRWQDL